MAHSAVSSPLIRFVITCSIFTTALAAIVSKGGDSAIIPSWRVQTSSKTGNDVAQLSSATFDTSSWYTIGSKATLMSTLIENNVYTESELFYSTNLQHVDYSQFQIPWFYRSEFELDSADGNYFQLKTHGISSRADIWLNGETVAEKDVQVGAYVGLTYDISGKANQGKNVLLVRVYSTDYDRDLALGFVDWNPYPPDNGTGIWRDVEIKQTGSVSISSPRVTTTLEGLVSIKLDVTNLGQKEAKGEVICTVSDPEGNDIGAPSSVFDVSGSSQQTLAFTFQVQNPQIWWPAQWGSQPLYCLSCSAVISPSSSSSTPSDKTPKTHFGIRTVTSALNTNDDIVFSVNNQPFQVLGAGYTSDIFLRFSESKLEAQFTYALSMGLNTIRLEGKQEHPYLYSLADRLGIMLLAGWECCDKWEGWSYNDEGSGEKWTNADYTIANHSMRHEAETMQAHPSLLGFLIGSDFWPDDRATQIYVDALHAFDWPAPILASASQRGFPALLGNAGMKMDGPYDWVPPAYWTPAADPQLGAAFGFASELGAGVGTPEAASLRRFLSPADQRDLYEAPEKGLYHMSTNVSSFYTRTIYNAALWARYGAPASLDEYLVDAQMADYEATRAQFEAYVVRWSVGEGGRAATGLVYWMLNNAWPSLHWNLFDYYLHPGGSFFGVKAATREVNAVFEYGNGDVWLVNRGRGGIERDVEVEVLGLDGKRVSQERFSATAGPDRSVRVGKVEVPKDKSMVLLRLTVHGDAEARVTNTYWLSSTQEELDWDDSTWYHTPVSQYADFTALNAMEKADVGVSTEKGVVVLENKSEVPAVFIRLNLVDARGEDVLPVMWQDNYITLWPRERVEVAVQYGEEWAGVQVQVDGKNVEAKTVALGGGGGGSY